MSVVDLLKATGATEQTEQRVEAQRQWLRTGTVSAEYVRSESNGSFSNRENTTVRLVTVVTAVLAGKGSASSRA